MDKPFLSYADQIEKLKNKLLQIPDPAYAEMILKEIGYFSLINGYKEPFKNPTTKNYQDGTSFQDIVVLYRLDENLRELFLKYILRLEKHIRSLVSYYFTEKYGNKQSCYLDVANFIQGSKYQRNVQRLISTLDNLANKNCDYPYINHQRQIYGNVPLWVLVNGITFGSLSKFYSLMTPDLRIKVAQNFDHVNQKQLEQYLTVITKFRNVCAHGERLYSYQTKDDIPDTTLHQKLLISQKGTQYIYGKRDLFSLVISFRYLLSGEDFKKFKQRLIRILAHYMSSQSFISESKLFEMMGFPENWKKISLYRK